ncbi:putative mfs multidrug [Phaeomoniella chlamydospora]|uniref:Putative mfs multidrug n=1 Tax=Phaeomoniella chlamydospora TaxID=158046 RepID=A0A0G2GWS3_PHACM|nr:putative mfs multidrug [Phaeomoniella chlamydospora]
MTSAEGQRQANGTHQPTERSPLLASNHGSDTQIIETRNGEQETQPQDDNDTPLAKEPSFKYLLVIVATVWTGSFFAALDTTIVATLAGPISSSFDSFTLYSWLASAYLIANAAFQPLSGKLTDIFSRRSGLVFANLSFAIGNLICGLAKSPSVMILGRVVSGFGGGGLQTVSVFVVTDLIPLRRRGLWQGFGNIVFGLGMGLGGTFGGLMNDRLNWRWGFLIQVPFFAINALICYFVINIPVKSTDKARWKRVDFLGSFLLVTSLVLLLIGLNTGGNQVPWTHPLILTTIPLSFVVLAAYIYVEACGVPEPIIPVRLLTRRTVFWACFTNWFGAMSAFTALYYLPLFAQAKGESSARSGLRQIPFAAGTSLGSLSAGYIMRLTGRYRYLTIFISSILLLSGILIFTTLNFTTPDWKAYLYLSFSGFGYGGLLTVTIVAMIAAVDHIHQATITAASYAFRSTGSSIGITISSAVFQNLLTKSLCSRFASHPHADQIIRRIREDFGSINRIGVPGSGIPEEWRQGVVKSYMDAFKGVWATLLGMVVLCALSSLLMREHKLFATLERK